MALIENGPHACFRAALERALERVDHEGALPSPNGGARTYSVSEEGTTLSVSVSTAEGPATVVAARHSGAAEKWTRAACEAFCGLIEGLPLQEAAEHGSIQLIERLRDEATPAPVPGILTPTNAGPAFGLLARLMRAVYAEHLAATGAKAGLNTWNPRLPSEWMRKRTDEQIEMLRPLLASQLGEEGLGPDAAEITGVDRGLRVTMSFSPSVPPQVKPALLMRVERRMRRETGGRLEVFAEEMRDQNVIRRL